MIEAQTVCEAFWRGQTRRFAVALADGFLHFWEADSPEREKTPGEKLFILVEQFRMSRTAQINPDFVRHNFEVEWERLRLGRVNVARVVDADEIVVFLQPDGAGRASKMVARDDGFSHPHERATPFDFEGGENVFALSNEQWRAQLEQWMKEETTDFAFALRWMDASHAEKTRLLFQLGRGDWEELGAIADLILQLEGDAGVAQNAGYEDDEETVIVHISLSGADGEWTTEHQVSGLNGETLVGPLWEIWFAFFQPGVRIEVVEQHSAARESAKAWNHSQLVEVRVRTSHEQLEARLELRGWLRERANLDDERIAQLLN